MKSLRLITFAIWTLALLATQQVKPSQTNIIRGPLYEDSERCCSHECVRAMQFQKEDLSTRQNLALS